MAVIAQEQDAQTLEVAHRRVQQKKRMEMIGQQAVVYALLIAGAIIFVGPFAWMFSASLQDVSDMFSWPPTWIPANPSFTNYVEFFQQERIGRYFFNSAYVAITVTALQMFTSSLAAYTFAKRRFPGRDFLFIFTLATLMIPGQVTLIPNYVILKHIPFFGGNDAMGIGGSGWLDSYWGLIVPQAASAFGIFLLRQYMMSIPDDLLDAARIDGASEFRIYAQIVMPLARPALAALGIFTVTYQWDDFFWPLIIVTSEELRTLPLGLALFVVRNRTVWDLLMAGSVIATVPMVIIFLLFQRQFIRGIAISGMK